MLNRPVSTSIFFLFPIYQFISKATLSQSPSQSSFEDSSVASLNPTARIPSGKNTKAGSSTNLHHASQNRDDIPPTRVSPRVSRPTLKKLASAFERRSRLPKSDGAPPRSILPLAPPPSLKQKKPTSTPIKSEEYCPSFSPRTCSHHTPKAGCSTNLGAASQSRDVIPPTRVSPRVSRPTFKKRASVLERRSCSLKSDGTPPLSILPPTSPPSLKRKKPTGTPIKSEKYCPSFPPRTCSHHTPQDLVGITLRLRVNVGTLVESPFTY